MTERPSPATSAQRLFYFDLARALLMFLGVPYHVARIYGSGRDNAVLSNDRSTVLDLLAEFLHSFRMESFFAVAGFFSLLILLREPVWTWLQGRLVRIAVPLICCTLLFAPVQAYTLTRYAMMTGALPSGDFGDAFLARYLALPYTVMHLWFLHALLGLTIALAAAAWICRSIPACGRLASALADGLARLSSRPFWMGGILLAALFSIVWMVSPPPQPFIPMFFVNKIWLFAPFFLFGAAMAARPALREWMIRTDALTPLLALAFSALFVVADHVAGSGSMLRAVGACGAGLFWLHTILSMAARHLDRHSPLVRHMCDASFTVYLFHLPIALLLALPLLRVSWPPVLEFLILVTVTTALSLIIHEIIRKSALLSLMFNGVSPAKFHRKSSAAA